MTGALNVEFGNLGKQTVESEGSVQTAASALTSQGQIMVAGTVKNADGTSEFTLTRLEKNGKIDTTFGTNGRAKAGFQFRSYNTANAVALSIDSQGRTIVAGTVRNNATGLSDLGLIRFTPTGSVDTSFGYLGTSVAEFGTQGRSDTAASLAIDPTGRILVAGTLDQGNGNTDFAVTRIGANGYTDTTFGNRGVQTVSFNVGGDLKDSASAIRLDSQGRIIIAGTASMATGSDFALARLTSNGQLDTTFGQSGKSTLGFSLPGNQSDTATSMSLDRQGRIVVGGWSHTNWGDDFVVARFLSDGRPDWSYGWGARQNVSFDLTTPNIDRSTSMLLDYMDRVVLVGTVGRTTGTDVGVARLTVQGQPDTSFTANGRRTVSFDLDATNVDSAASVVMDGKGSLIVTGTSRRNGKDVMTMCSIEGQQTTVGMFGDILVVSGTSDNDVINIINDGSTIRVNGVTQIDSNDRLKDLDFSIPVTQVNQVWVYGGAGNDTIRIQDEKATKLMTTSIQGDQGDDTIYGGRGVDEIYGNAGNDQLFGGVGNDTLYGNEGADRLDGQSGADTIYALDGMDTIIPDASDTVYQRTAILNKASKSLEITGSNLADNISLVVQVFATLTTTTYSFVMNDLPVLVKDGATSYFVNSIRVTDLDRITINTQGGDDTISFDTGFGKVLAGNGPNVVINSGSGNDTITVNAWSSNIAAGDGDDTIYGGFGVDFVEGENGNDTIYGGSGNDILSGDDYNLQRTSRGFVGGVDRIYGGLGNDTIYGGEMTDWLYGGELVETAEFQNDADVLYGGYTYDSAEIGSGDDYVKGGLGDDVLYGGKGNDDLNGGAGITMGQTADRYFSGNDRIFGGDGSDYLFGWGGDDTLEGGDGADTLFGHEGADRLNGGKGGDYLYGGQGEDVLVALDDFYSDVLDGGPAIDVMWFDHPGLEYFGTGDTVRKESFDIVHGVSSFQNGADRTLDGDNIADPSLASFPNFSYQRFQAVQLFASNRPTRNDVQQGALGDCYFLAGLAALAQDQNRAIRQNIVDLSDGTYAVRLGYSYFRVDNELPIYATTGIATSPAFAGLGPSRVMWVAIYEKAFTFYRGAGSYIGIHGGHGDETHTAFRSYTNDARSFSNYSSARDLATAINDWSVAGGAVTLAIFTNANSSSKLVDRHAFAFIMAKRDAQGSITEVVLRNPWGNDVTLTIAELFSASNTSAFYRGVAT
jgi:uncharacterized delta-60 repeat protein